VDKHRTNPGSDCEDGVLKVLDLFSGIGGFSLGLESVGFETVGFCEIDPFCQKVLKKHWPDIPIHEDIKELDGHEYRGSVRLVCGGFPCQPYSLASRHRSGSEDDRHLWPEMFRVIREVQPDWVIGENVLGIVSMELDNVLADLGDSFDVQTFDIPAVAVNARHLRHRVWIIGRAKRLADANATRQHSDQADGWGEGSQGSQHDARGRSQVMADTSSERMEGNRPAGFEEPRASPGATLSGRDCSGSGANQWSSLEPVGRVVDGFPGRVDELRSLGNAVVPQLVSQIGRLIMQHDMEYST
jgi:DNA (cytosine-5)-methyltransferase 1